MKKPIPFGKYLLLERVNVGGMAEVFKAKAFGVEGFERLVAVKRILPSIAEDKEFVEMFIDEAKIAVQLTHANVAQIFDLGKVGDSYFIAMEYVHGKDLRAIFDRARKRGEPLPIPMACYITMKVCEGLDYAHNKRDAAGRELDLVHRDVSPQNVLISYDGEVKVIDFGIAKAAGKAGKTQAGILKGKFGYMSPEQVRGLPLDRRSDIFAVGIVLYELLTGERLFVGESDFSTLEKVRNVEIMPPSTYNRRIPEELEQIVLKALAKDVDDRYQTAMDLHDDLQSFMYTSGNFFARKDLSGYQRKAFADEIVKESARDEEYRKLEAPDVSTSEELDDIPSESGELESLDTPTPQPIRAPARPSHPAGRSTPAPQAASVSQQPATAPGRRAVPKPLPPTAGPPTSSRPAMQSVTPVHAAPPRPHGPSGPPMQRASGAPNGGMMGQAAMPLPTNRMGGPALNMEWDDDELSTQIYDKPDDAPEIVTPPKGYQLGAPSAGPPQHSAPHPAFAPMSPSGPPSGPVSLSSPPFGVTPVSGPRGGTGPYSPASAPGFPSPFDYSAEQSVAPPVVENTTAAPRPAVADRPKPPIALLAAAAVALLVVVAVGGYMLLHNDTATLQLEVRPPDAVVLIDPQGPTERRFPGPSPYIISAITPDEPHTVLVTREGYESWTRPIYLTPGQFLQLPAIELERSGGGNRGGDRTVAQLEGTGFALDTEPAGAKVFIDGVEREGRTPVTFLNLTPGPHRIRLDHSTRYTPHEFVIEVREGIIAQLPKTVLALRAINVDFRSTPPGAEVRLRRGADTRTIGATPVSAEIEITGGTWAVEMSKTGYQTWTQELEIPSGQTTVDVRATLQQLVGQAPPEVAVAPPVVEETRPPPSRNNNTSHTPRPPRPPRPDPPVASGGTGTVVLNSVPWSQVTVDGRPAGNTPVRNLSLPAGSHTFRFTNGLIPEQVETRRVNIQAGANPTIVVRFQ